LVGQCGKKYQKVECQRSDFHHEVALCLVREYDVINLEDLQIRNLLIVDRDENAALNSLESGRAGPSGANVGGCTERRLRSPAL
jgi:transposase